MSLSKSLYAPNVLDKDGVFCSRVPFGGASFVPPMPPRNDVPLQNMASWQTAFLGLPQQPVLRATPMRSAYVLPSVWREVFLHGPSYLDPAKDTPITNPGLKELATISYNCDGKNDGKNDGKEWSAAACGVVADVSPKPSFTPIASSFYSTIH